MAGTPESRAAKQIIKLIEPIGFDTDWLAMSILTQAETSLPHHLRLADCIASIQQVWSDWYATGYVSPGDSIYAVCEQAYRVIHMDDVV